MKQHITLSQIDELSGKEKEKLEKWWLKHKKTRDASNEVLDFPYELPLLSIGQMIEFLADQEEIGKDWDWFLREKSGFPDNEVLNPDTLCDALWKAVKEVLEK